MSFKLIECKADSDVVAVRVRAFPGEVQVEIQDDPFEGKTLITGRLLPSQAVRLARALLAAAGVNGVRCADAARHPNVTRYTFID